MINRLRTNIKVVVMETTTTNRSTKGGAVGWIFHHALEAAEKFVIRVQSRRRQLKILLTVVTKLKRCYKP